MRLPGGQRGRLAERFSELAARHLGVRTDVVAPPLLHDTPDELAQPMGEVRDWRAGECEPVPGLTMPRIVAVERDYGAVYEKWSALGPLVERLGVGVKGVSWRPDAEVAELRERLGAVADGVAAGRPRLDQDRDMCEVILALSGVSNGRLAREGFAALEARAGVPLADIADDHADARITNRPLFHRGRPPATSFSAVAASGFSMKRATAWTRAKPGSSPPASM